MGELKITKLKGETTWILNKKKGAEIEKFAETSINFSEIYKMLIREEADMLMIIEHERNIVYLFHMTVEDHINKMSVEKITPYKATKIEEL